MSSTSTENTPTTQPTTQPYIDTRPPLRRPRPKEMCDMQRHVEAMLVHAIGSKERDRLEKAFLVRWRSFAEANTRFHRGPDIDDAELEAAAVAAMMLAVRSWRPGGRPVDCWIRQAVRWESAKVLVQSRLVRARPSRDLVSIQIGSVSTESRNVISEDVLDSRLRELSGDDEDDRKMKRRLDAWDSLPSNYKQALLEEHKLIPKVRETERRIESLEKKEKAGKLDDDQKDELNRLRKQLQGMMAKRTMSDIKRRTIVKLAMLRLEGGGKL